MKRRPLFLEVLEDRTTPAFFNWTGTAGDNLWGTPGNWDQNALPTISDDVSISQANTDILVNQAGAVRSVSMMSSVNLIVNNSLTIDQSANISGQLIVAGTLTANANASLWPSGGIVVSGAINLEIGSQLTVMSGSSILRDGAAIAGAGTVSLGMGNLTVEGTATFHNFNMTGGNLLGPGMLTITGTMNWEGGNLANTPYAGTLDITDTGALNITGYGTKSIQGWTVNIDGDGNWTQGDVGNEASMVNISTTGEFNISVSFGTWRDTYQDGLSTINNAGTINSTGGMVGMPVVLKVALLSSGTIDVAGGSLGLGGGGVLGGQIAIASTSELGLAAGEFGGAVPQFIGGGTGQLIIGSGAAPGEQATLRIDAGQTFVGYNVLLRTLGTITGQGTMVFAGQSELNGGFFLGPLNQGPVRNIGTLRITAASLSFRLRTFTNQGIVIWSGGPGLSSTLTLGSTTTNSGVIIIEPTFFRTLRLIAVNEQGVDFNFTNHGQITIAGSGVVTTESSANVAFTLTNTGTISLDLGATLNLGGYFVNQANGFVTTNVGTAANFGTNVNFEGGAPAPGAALRGGGMFYAGTGDHNTTLHVDLGLMVEVERLTLGTRATAILIGTLRPHFLNLAGDLQGTDQTNPQNTGRLLLELTDDVDITGNISISDVLIENHGLIRWLSPSGTITINGSASVLNSGGIFEVNNSLNTIARGLPGEGEFVIRNGGRLEFVDSCPCDFTHFDIPVWNDGASVIAYRELRFATYSQTGVNATLQFSGPQLTIDGLLCSRPFSETCVVKFRAFFSKLAQLGTGRFPKLLAWTLSSNSNRTFAT
ncbi:MAG: hypothetical protein HYX68_06650, partial [Planctomycetes bacterium]|nr:hypothetical protein [Planctomycetota bacterium]